MAELPQMELPQATRMASLGDRPRKCPICVLAKMPTSTTMTMESSMMGPALSSEGRSMETPSRTMANSSTCLAEKSMPGSRRLSICQNVRTSMPSRIAITSPSMMGWPSASTSSHCNNTASAAMTTENPTPGATFTSQSFNAILL